MNRDRTVPSSSFLAPFASNSSDNGGRYGDVPEKPGKTIVSRLSRKRGSHRSRRCNYPEFCVLSKPLSRIPVSQVSVISLASPPE